MSESDRLLTRAEAETALLALLTAGCAGDTAGAQQALAALPAPLQKLVHAARFAFPSEPRMATANAQALVRKFAHRTRSQRALDPTADALLALAQRYPGSVLRATDD